MNLAQWKNERQKRLNLVAYWELELEEAKTFDEKCKAGCQIVRNEAMYNITQKTITQMEIEVGIGERERK